MNTEIFRVLLLFSIGFFLILMVVGIVLMAQTLRENDDD